MMQAVINSCFWGPLQGSDGDEPTLGQAAWATCSDDPWPAPATPALAPAASSGLAVLLSFVVTLAVGLVFN